MFIQVTSPIFETKKHHIILTIDEDDNDDADEHYT